MESYLKQKERLIKLGIIEIDKCKESLFQLKKYFYGDFKYNEELKKVPHPNQLIQEAYCMACIDHLEDEKEGKNINDN